MFTSFTLGGDNKLIFIVPVCQLVCLLDNSKSYKLILVKFFSDVAEAKLGILD